ncbi:MAG: iron-containing alcohol dehydrogenase [Oscillospiraceae bacterium]|nr:iron-containing alcohol dehydrogenase [Oscillospiraceae bacterium]
MEFYCKTRIFAGQGILKELKTLNMGRVMLVCDPFFVQNGWTQKIQHLSGAAQFEIFDEISPDPTAVLAAKGTAKMNAFCPDTVIALGGGSAMDCAKAMVYFAEKTARLIAVPTTSGSGSEVTDFAILTHDGVKHPLIDEKICPEAAFLDSDLLETLPKTLIADCGFDVLSHAAEGYAATKATPFTDALAESAFATVLQKLPDSFGGDTSCRLEIHCCATMAGISFTRAGLGLVHALAHSLGGEFHIPHGRLNAILLPAVIEHNKAARHKYANLARRAGLSGVSDTVAVKNLKNALYRLRQELNMPDTLIAAGISPAELWNKREKIITAALHDPCCNTNPQPVTEETVRFVLEEVTGRG